MKKVLTISLFITLFAVSCTKDCPESEMAMCLETAPENELCMAYFERWFFQKKSNTCEMIAYSGCSEKGFDTREACEACTCK
ncbi:MAG: BPTI/Kunitz-type proteinase inhibitor domain-containing protein [Cyclobacteriaceae bacterium]|nr:BPTI/Kunitz-type proteinase inhibitor domain-containing protein [Cyclobacteriaceae bacterium]